MERLLLLGVVVVNSISIFGYAFFALRPENLAAWPGAPEIFAQSYPFFAQAQIGFAFLALAVGLSRYTGRRWILPFVAVYLLSFLSEFMGTSYGIPFGKYEYTGLLGYKLFDRVPFLIPLSWFFMALPSYVLAGRVFPNPMQAMKRVVVGSLLLLSWDLSLDPAMSHLTPFWLWDAKGVYYGMPFMNLVGWYVTGLVLMYTLEKFKALDWTQSVPRHFFPILYLANLMLPVGMCVAAGLWWAILTTAISGAAYFVLVGTRVRGEGTNSTQPQAWAAG